ncbi:YibE/F family protein [Catenibacterium mitsuokai]|uniref:YibE/F family protein n=1 Tax=Catenibacterium mitsuokai TaxID=100886 RepID=UPI0039B0BEE1
MFIFCYRNFTIFYCYKRINFIYNYYCVPYIYAFIELLLIIIFLIGRSKGIRAIISLGFTLFAIIDLLLPLIFNRYSPILSTLTIVILTKNTSQSTTHDLKVMGL